MSLQANVLSDKWLQGVGYLAKARVLVVETRDYDVKHSRTDDESYRAEYEDKVKETQASVAAHFKDYETLLAGDAERAKFATLTNAVDGYRKAQAKVVALGRDNEGGDSAIRPAP